MRQQRPLVPSILVVLFVVLLPGTSAAQSAYRYTAALMLGFGSATGSEPSSTTSGEVFLAEDSFELGLAAYFSMETAPRARFAARLGQLEVEVDRASGGSVPFDSELTYLTLAGEYRFAADYYESALFLGLGAYGVDGKGAVDDDTGFGLTVGALGDFRVSDRWSILVELSGHYADLESAQLFLMGHAGLAYHF